MRMRNTAAAAAVALALAATATACGGEKGTAGDKPKGGEVYNGSYTVAKDVKLDSPTLKAAQKRGKIVIGAKADQPFLGFVDTERSEERRVGKECRSSGRPDVCSSDLQGREAGLADPEGGAEARQDRHRCQGRPALPGLRGHREIGRASCRERV